MRDTEIFSSLLGLTSGWTVSSVDLRPDVQSVRLQVVFDGKGSCPVCGRSCSLYDHSEERLWRHLDTMQFMTFVACRVPRVDCSEHGVRQMEVPWAGPKSRFTSMFERLAIEILQMTRCQSRTAKILRLNAGQVHDLMNRAVRRGLSRRNLEDVRHVSLDEKAFQRGHVYGTVAVDVLGRRVLDFVLERDEAAAVQALSSIENLQAVQTVTMDMWQAYKNAAARCCPNADVIHDRFHIALMLSQAVEQTRRAETKKHPELKGSRYLWLKNPCNRSESQQARLEPLLKVELATARAYAFKEVFRRFFDLDDEDFALTFLKEWLAALKAAKLPTMKRAAKTIANNARGLLNYIRHKLTNGYTEAVNGLIQEVKTVARGFRRFENFRVAILFFLGKLDLYPRNSS